MTTVLWPLALLTLGALAAASVLNRKIEETLPVTMLGAMLVLYGFYAFDLLRLGRAAVIAACAALIAAAAVKLFLRHGLAAFVKGSVLTPQMAVYAGLTVFFYFLSQGKLVGVWDELRLWGSLPKALHAYGTLQLGAESSLYAFSQSYPPAMPLLQYFFASFSPVFSEGSLFFTRAWFGLALLLPLTRGMTWKNWHGLIAVSFLMVFLPYWLTTNDPDFAYYYESLFVDAPAGILCGFLCWQAMDGSDQDWFYAAVLCVSLAALTLMKDFGVLFGGLCVLGSLWRALRAAKRKRAKAALTQTAIAAATLGAAYLSWQILMRVHHVINYNTVDATLPTWAALSTSLQYFFSSVISVSVSVASASVPLGAVLLGQILLYAFLVYRDFQTFREDLPFILLRLIGYGGYFFAYVMMFRDDIAGGVFPSIARYMVAMALCETVVFLMSWRKASRRDGRFLHRAFPTLGAWGKAAAALLTAALLSLSVFTVQSFWKYDGGVYGDAETAAGLVTQTVGTDTGEIADVWLVIGGDAWENSLLHHRVYFDLVGSGARIKTYILDANITQSGNAYTEDSFLSALSDGGYEYVLVVYGDDELAEEFGGLFPELIPYETDFLLYRVQRAQDGSGSLALVAQTQP
jgi:hypothetical protein